MDPACHIVEVCWSTGRHIFSPTFHFSFTSVVEKQEQKLPVCTEARADLKPWRAHAEDDKSDDGGGDSDERKQKKKKRILLLTRPDQVGLAIRVHLVKREWGKRNLGHIQWSLKSKMELLTNNAEVLASKANQWFQTYLGKNILTECYA